jgi:hypothetical protein
VAEEIGEREERVATVDGLACAVDIKDEMVAHGGRLKRLTPGR